MARISEKYLKDRVALLNRTYGFKGKKAVRLKSGKIRWSGTGFSLGYAYGGVRLEFEAKRGTRDVSDRMSKTELNGYIGGMLTAVRYWKERAKLK